MNPEGRIQNPIDKLPVEGSSDDEKFLLCETEFFTLFEKIPFLLDEGLRSCDPVFLSNAQDDSEA
jgi:hypothetical protein